MFLFLRHSCGFIRKIRKVMRRLHYFLNRISPPIHDFHVFYPLEGVILQQTLSLFG